MPIGAISSSSNWSSSSPEPRQIGLGPPGPIDDGFVPRRVTRTTKQAGTSGEDCMDSVRFGPEVAVSAAGRISKRSISLRRLGQVGKLMVMVVRGRRHAQRQRRVRGRLRVQRTVEPVKRQSARQSRATRTTMRATRGGFGTNWSYQDQNDHAGLLVDGKPSEIVRGHGSASCRHPSLSQRCAGPGSSHPSPWRYPASAEAGR